MASSRLRGSSHGAGAGADAGATKAQQREERRTRAIAELQKAGNTLQSTTLLAIVSRASAGPFEKVKVMIEKLIERLISEATSEASKKGYCDTALSKAETDRTFRYESVMTLNAEIYSLEVKRDTLEAEISELTDAIATLTSDLATTTEARETEKASNLAILKTAKEGAVALHEAIMILKTFYSEAAKAKPVLAQYSPVQDDTSGPGFEGNYAGKQDSIKGVMGLLEVLKSDFARTMTKTGEAEKEAAAAFVLYERGAKADIASKTTKKGLDEDDLATTLASIDSKFAEMKTNMELVDEANKEIESLKPMCIDSGMSFEERTAKREEEIEHLKTALCILDENKVEAECAGR